MSAFDFNKYAGAGMDDLPQSDGMPVLKIIQKGSPEFDESHKKYKDKKIDGCRPGDIVFKGAIVKRPVRVVPIGATQLYAEFKPAASGGGFVSNRDLSVINAPGYRKGTPGSPNEHKEYLGENELQFNIVYAIKAHIEGEWVDAIIMFSSTELKAARAWSRLIKGSKHPNVPGVPPIFANTYMLSTGPQSNSKGTWMGWDITRPTDSAVTSDEDLQNFAEAFTNVQKALPRAQGEAQKALPSPGVANTSESSDGPF